MIEVFYRYRVHPSQARAFEHAYGSAGPFAELFEKSPGYLRTRLFRHKRDPAIYVTADVWEGRAAWEAFRSENAEAYARLDRQLHLLFLEEQLIGYYEGEDEYRAPLDTLA